jgi:hypothetical protein
VDPLHYYTVLYYGLLVSHGTVLYSNAEDPGPGKQVTNRVCIAHQHCGVMLLPV